MPLLGSVCVLVNFPPMPKVFISYRRSDGAGHAGRLFDSLCEELGAQSLFMDVDGIGPGHDFKRAIEDAIAKCDVVLVVITRDWAHVTDERGRRRLEQADDFVRLEVVAALRRQIRVVPVLVQRAALPKVDEVPEELRPLVQRQAFELRDERWRDDTRALSRNLKDAGARARRLRRSMFGAALGALGIAGALLLAAALRADCQVPSSGKALFASTQPAAWHAIQDGSLQASVASTDERCGQEPTVRVAIPGAAGEDGTGAFVDLRGESSRWGGSSKLHINVRMEDTTPVGRAVVYVLSDVPGQSGYCACYWSRELLAIERGEWVDLALRLQPVEQVYCEPTNPSPSPCTFNPHQVDQLGIKVHANEGRMEMQVGPVWLE